MRPLNVELIVLDFMKNRSPDCNESTPEKCIPIKEFPDITGEPLSPDCDKYGALAVSVINVSNTPLKSRSKERVIPIPFTNAVRSADFPPDIVTCIPTNGFAVVAGSTIPNTRSVAQLT